jgi:hypothetical protein
VQSVSVRIYQTFAADLLLLVRDFAMATVPSQPADFQGTLNKLEPLVGMLLEQQQGDTSSSLGSWAASPADNTPAGLKV